MAPGEGRVRVWPLVGCPGSSGWPLNYSHTSRTTQIQWVKKEGCVWRDEVEGIGRGGFGGRMGKVGCDQNVWNLHLHQTKLN